MIGDLEDLEFTEEDEGEKETGRSIVNINVSPLCIILLAFIAACLLWASWLLKSEEFIYQIIIACTIVFLVTYVLGKILQAIEKRWPTPDQSEEEDGKIDW